MSTGHPRISKTTLHKLRDLEDHAFLLSNALDGLESGRSAHIRHIAAELRTLVCFSSRTEGLLWRLIDEFAVSDSVELHRIGQIDRRHPLSQRLNFFFMHAATPGHGDPRLPVKSYSLRYIIKETEAFYSGKSGHSHEKIIKAFSQQIGTAHEDDGISDFIAEINSIKFGGMQPFYQLLYSDAYLTLMVIDRILTHVEKSIFFERQHKSSFKERILPPSLNLAETILAPTVESMNNMEGAVIFSLSWQPWFEERHRPTVLFDEIEVGGFSVQCSLSPARFFEIKILGLFSSPILVVKRLLIETTREINIGITWKNPVVNIFVNGNAIRRISDDGFYLEPYSKKDHN